MKTVYVVQYIGYRDVSTDEIQTCYTLEEARAVREHITRNAEIRSRIKIFKITTTEEEVV